MREPVQLDLFPAPSPESDRSVISIKTREAWVPPEVAAVEIETIYEGPAIDTESVKICQRVLGDLETGEIEGLCVLTWSRVSGRFNYSVTLPNALRERDHLIISETAFKWAGGLDFLKSNVVDMAVIAGDYEPDLIISEEVGQE